jgi:hypothetical protein
LTAGVRGAGQRDAAGCKQANSQCNNGFHFITPSS